MPLRETFCPDHYSLIYNKREICLCGCLLCWYLNSTSYIKLSIMFAITVLDYTEHGSRLLQPGERQHENDVSKCCI